MKMAVNVLFWIGVVLVLAALIGRFIGNPATVAGIGRTGVALNGVALMAIAIYLKLDTCGK